MVAEIQTAQDVWPVLNPVVFVPHEESEYQRLVASRLFSTILSFFGTGRFD